MPENEKKFVTRGYDELETLLTPFGWQDIEQGYLNKENRVRRIVSPNGTCQHWFAFKQRLANGHNLEIEPLISEALYEEAWEYTRERVRKRRITIYQARPNLKWDIDFYRWPDDAKYFVLAEVEMPPEMVEPEAVLPHLEPHLVYAVPRDDGRFAARRLANAAHAAAMARELGLL